MKNLILQLKNGILNKYYGEACLVSSGVSWLDGIDIDMQSAAL
jgi:hypothetical protein